MNTGNKGHIEIFTFGNFDITLDGKSVFKKVGRKYKNLELLKFFITNRNRRVIPENIIDFFWSDKEYEDPKNALSTQIHRLKKILRDLDLMKPGKDSDDYLELQFVNGFYVFNTGSKCIVDADVFKEKVAMADSFKKNDPEKAIKIYKEIVDMYKGQHMEENVYSEWAVHIRNKYHRMYIQSVIKLLELLKSQRRNNEIVDLFEDIVVIEPYEEGFHIYFMEALMEMKEYRYALSHYNYVSTKMYKDIGVRPSSSLSNLYRKVLRETDENEEIDLFFIDKKFTEEEILDGAIFCEADYFKFAYNMEKRKSLRYGKNSVLMIITLIKADSSSKVEVEKTVKTLRDILLQSLRKIDLVARWNHNQILILLMNIKELHLEVIAERIEDKFESVVDNNLYKINIASRYVSPKNS